MKVIIIGAGIAGLTLGLACQRAGMEVKIIEKAQELRTIGGGILLWPHGLHYLQQLGLADCLQTSWMSVRGMNICNHSGQYIYREEHAELYSLLDGEILPIDRSQLQQLLVAQLAQDTLTLGKACSKVENHADHVRVFFADGSEESADLVVGADGIHSAVRQAVFPHAKPAYSGFCWWGGIAARHYVPHFPVAEVQIVLGQSKLCSIWPTHGENFMWYLPVKMPLQDFAVQGDGRLQAETICQGWNDDVLRLIIAPQRAQRFHVPIYELAPARSAVGRTVLIGDAASAFGPLLGQGANKAIEDAYVLALLLQHQTGDLPEILNRYEQLRHARHQRFFELERMSADAMIHDTSEALQFFEEQLPLINLTIMYQDMIPLVNREACEKLRVEALQTDEEQSAAWQLGVLHSS